MTISVLTDLATVLDLAPAEDSNNILSLALVLFILSFLTGMVLFTDKNRKTLLAFGVLSAFFVIAAIIVSCIYADRKEDTETQLIKKISTEIKQGYGLDISDYDIATMVPSIKIYNQILESQNSVTNSESVKILGNDGKQFNVSLSKQGDTVVLINADTRENLPTVDDEDKALGW